MRAPGTSVALNPVTGVLIGRERRRHRGEAAWRRRRGRGWSEAAPARDAPGAPDTPPTPGAPTPGRSEALPALVCLVVSELVENTLVLSKVPRWQRGLWSCPPGPRPRLPLVSSLPPLLRPPTSGSKPHMRVLARTSPHRGPCPSARHQAGTSPVPGEHPSRSGAPPRPAPCTGFNRPLLRWQIPPTQTSE